MARGIKRVSFRSSDRASLAPPVLMSLDHTAPEIPTDMEAAARYYVETMFTQPTTPSFSASAEEPVSEVPDLTCDGVDDNPLVKSKVVGFRQSWRGVPIYGARLGVEMSPERELRSISGYVVDRIDVDPIATVSPADARDVLTEIIELSAHAPVQPEQAPKLVFRFEEASGRWRLVYLFDDVLIGYEKEDQPAGDAASNWRDASAPARYRVFIDAHSGKEVARIPKSHSLEDVDAYGEDADGTRHEFKAVKDGDLYVLEDRVRRIRTLSMQFSDISCGPLEMPGNRVTSSSAEFAQSAAVVAHANASRVYDFFKNELLRDSIDGHGMWIISSVECLRYRLKRHPLFGTYYCVDEDPDVRAWRNAAWTGDQMLYGQRLWTDGRLHSYAESLDIVAHELTHGITDRSSELEYRTESGALNESYSDILGIAISNADRDQVPDWDWRLGEEIAEDWIPIRNLADPTLHGQPAHMDDFKKLGFGEEPSQANDQGYVHHNSGIHNKAAYNLLVAGKFTWHEVVQLFYLTLTIPGRLSATSTFADSKAGMMESCDSLFAGAADFGQRMDAIRQAFDDVGIS